MHCTRDRDDLGTWDLVAIVAYFVLVSAAGFWSMFRSNRGTVSGYFLAGRFMWWLPIGASLFATNIGSEHFIGLAGSGAAGGIGVGAFELNALIIIQLLGWVFLPVYIASGVHTLPEYMSKRFGRQRIRVYLAVLSLILYVFTKMSVNIYSGSLFVQELLGWNLWLSIALILALTAVCTITGGLAAVIYMDTFQCFLMVGGAIALAIISFNEVGGYQSMIDQYMHSKSPTTSWNDTCGLPSTKAMTMLRDPTDADYPWPGFLLGQTPASIWYWAADQMMVQRALAAKSLSHAQGATLFAGLLKITPLFVIVMPGMISRILCPEQIACVNDCMEHCGNPVSCTNLAYPKLILGLMPDGARGMMLAGMLAALMSDLTSLFNSASTLFTLDIWARMRPKASANEILIVGRLWVFVMVLIAVLWVPIIGQKQGGQLYLYIQSVAADLSPPIAAVYLLAILWKRTNETGAFWGLMIGFLTGMCRMCAEFVYVAPTCPDADTRPIFVRIHYMYFALFLFVLTVTATVLISLCTEPLPEHRLIRTTFWTRHSREPRPDDHDVKEADDNDEDVSTEEHVALTLKDQDQIDGTQIDADADLTTFPKSRPSIGPSSAPTGCGHRMKQLLFWFIGLEKESKIELTIFEQHLDKITNLEQSQTERIFLNIGLFVIISVAVVLFVYFSVFSSVQIR